MNSIDPILEREYNNRAMVPEHPAIFERWHRESVALRATADCSLDLAYGSHVRHRLDVFRAPHAVGTVIFIHGGYWRSLDKSDFSFLVGPLMSVGLSVAAINYRLCPAVAIGDIVDDCRAACDWLAAHGEAQGLNLSAVALAGHSAGGHLVASLFAGDRTGTTQIGMNIVGGAAVSGVFDLEPLLRCSMNADLHLEAEAARALSPIHLQPVLDAPLLLSVGTDESAAFRRQSAQLHEAWPRTCPPPLVLAGANHFTVVDQYFGPGAAGLLALRALFD